MTLADQLREYIRRRAEIEGVGFDLPIELFEQAVIRRAKTFGVVRDGRETIHHFL
jgi:hypothetical protein